MKPKVVREPQPGPVLTSKATRELTTFEKATSWVDDRGMIGVEEGIERVFLAAAEAGTYTVVTDVRRGRSDRLTFRSYPEALLVTLHYLIQDMGADDKKKRNPLLYAATYNRDALISAKGYKDDKTGKFVARNDAQADVFQHFLNLWCEHRGIKQTGPSELINKLRTPIYKRKIVRERLPIKRERL